MALTIPTETLSEALKAAAVTTKSKAQDETKFIRLSTERGPRLGAGEDSTGEATYLVAASYDGVIYGQALAEGEGDGFSPVLLDPSYIGLINAAIKTAKTNAPKGSTTYIVFDVNEETGQLNYRTRVDESHAPDDVFGQFPIAQDSFDVQQVINNLTPPVRNNVPTADGSGNVPDNSFVVFDPQALGTMKAISSAYGLNVQVYWCGNPANDRIITCGMYWRGTILGTAPDLTFYDPTTPEVPIMLTNGAAPAAADDAPGGDE